MWIGTHATIAEIAAAEKINESYVGRVLRLTLLAPDIVEAVLNGRQPAQVTLAGLTEPFPVEWDSQHLSLEKCSPFESDLSPSRPRRPRRASP
jgi:hypothetical protein